MTYSLIRLYLCMWSELLTLIGYVHLSGPSLLGDRFCLPESMEECVACVRDLFTV